MRIWLMFALLPALSACHQPPSTSPSADMTVATLTVSESSVAPIIVSSEQELSLVEPMPADIRAFTNKRDECDHWRGEEPYDDERAKEISGAINDTCTGTDDKLSKLRRKYKDRPSVLEVLAIYEDKIEN